MEKLVYEYRPQIYFLLSFYSVVVSHSSWIMVLSGLILAMCGYIIVQLRSNYRRRKAALQRAKIKRPAPIKWVA